MEQFKGHLGQRGLDKSKGQKWRMKEEWPENSFYTT